MKTLTIKYKDCVNCQLIGLDDDDRNILYQKFSIFVPSALFQPKYKLGMWDGYVHHFSLTGNTYVNFLPEIFNTINMNKYEVEETYTKELVEAPTFSYIDDNFLKEYKWPEGHRLAGQPVEMYEHQVDIVNTCLQHNRAIIEAATGAGKSLIAFALAKKVVEFGRFIIIEPSKDLTLQTAELFNSLGIPCGVCGCGKRELDKQVTICTWQTINSLEKRKKDISLTDDKRVLSADEMNTLKKDCLGILFDECHLAKAYQIQKVCNETFKDVPLRWGLTGTVPKDKSDKLSLFMSIGPVVHHLDSKELQDKGVLADCDITCIKLEDKSAFLEYADEMKYLSTNKERLNFINNLLENIVKEKGNTLVLVNRIATGELMEKDLLSKGCDCIFLDGSVKSADRMEEYKSINTANNKIIIATSQIASTGLDIPRLFNLVLLDYGKSFIKTIQSIGRGLRIGRDKTHIDIFDIFSTTPFSRKHFNDRVHYYDDKQFRFKVLDIPLWK